MNVCYNDFNFLITATDIDADCVCVVLLPKNLVKPATSTIVKHLLTLCAYFLCFRCHNDLLAVYLKAIIMTSNGTTDLDLKCNRWYVFKFVFDVFMSFNIVTLVKEFTRGTENSYRI